MYCKHSIILAILFSIYTSLASQEIAWKANVRSFFDNYEFSGSALTQSQTMAGVHLAPEIGLKWEKQHRIFAGLDLMREWGSERILDFCDPVIYYEYSGKPFRFYVGNIPRHMILDRYPRMFFSDSILNYRPVVNGIFWEYGQADGTYANVWLDWTGRQTRKTHESFFMGCSGRYNYGAFHLQHLGYMFHFAALKDPETDIPVHDNGLLLTSVGVNMNKRTVFTKLESSLGWVVALERDRGTNVWHTPQGILSETTLGYKWIELSNTYYKGGKQQVFYDTFGNALYWGDPVYRSGEYDRLDMSIHFIKNEVVDIKLTYSLHFAEKNIFHQQALYATFNLSNLCRPDDLKTKKGTQRTP
ncbi:MAG: hypothetical protein LBH04_05535 [Tannerellaceae bacterium]|nr:hypothetical protein [Tannerellaceae bacterium]